MNEHLSDVDITKYCNVYIKYMGNKYSSTVLRDEYNQCIKNGVLPKIKSIDLLNMKAIREIFPIDFNLSSDYINDIRVGKETDSLVSAIVGTDIGIGFDADMFYKQHIDDIIHMFNII